MKNKSNIFSACALVFSLTALILFLGQKPKPSNHGFPVYSSHYLYDSVNLAGKYLKTRTYGWVFFIKWEGPDQLVISDRNANFLLVASSDILDIADYPRGYPYTKN